MAIKRRNKVQASFSMSSMTDIVFLLLIFFMITSTLVHPNAIKLLIPRKSTTPTTKVKQFTQVRVTKSGTYYINGQKASTEGLEQAISKAMLQSKEPVIKLTTDKNVATGDATAVLDLAETNGYKVILDIR